MKVSQCKCGGWWKFLEMPDGTSVGEITIVGEPETRNGMFGPQQVVSVFDWLSPDAGLQKASLSASLQLGIRGWSEAESVPEDAELDGYRLQLRRTGAGRKTRVAVSGRTLTKEEIETVHAAVPAELPF